MNSSGVDLALVPEVVTAINEFTSGAPGRSIVLQPLRGATGTVRVHADEIRPAASLLKVPLVATLYADALAGKFDIEREVEGSELPRSIYPSVLAGFSSSHRFQLKELCQLALITSDNSIADYLLSAIGMQRVNKWSEEQGCRKTILRVGFSDEELGAAGRRNESTAQESLTLMRLVATDALYTDLSYALQNNLRNTRIPLRLPDDTRVLHKTGTLCGVVNDVGVILGRRLDLALAVLCDGESDNAQTSLEIGAMVATVCGALGERVAP